MLLKRLTALKPQVYLYLNQSLQVSSFNRPLSVNSHAFTNNRYYSAITSSGTFTGVLDRYNGVTIETSQEPCDVDIFPKKLDDSLDKWSKENKRCIWFKVNLTQSAWVPILAKRGFNFHHARDDFVMMYKWLPKDSSPNLPPSSYTNLGVGGLVLNNKNEILVISERHYEYPHWKLPGGYVEKGEHIIDAAAREVKEETGIDAVFQSLVTFRHTQNMMFGNADIYVIVRMKPTSDKIIVSNTEVNECRWMPIDEYTNHEHVHKWNRFVVNQTLKHENMGIKMNLYKETAKWGPNIRQINYMVIENLNQ